MVVMANYLNMNIVAGQRNQQHQRDAGAGHQLHQERERVAAGGAQRDQDRGAQEAPDADPRAGRQTLLSLDLPYRTRHGTKFDIVWNGEYNIPNNYIYYTMAYSLLKVATMAI